MKHLLLLVHRIPYPPNKGDKIRSFHLLRYLSQRYKVLLGAFVDSEEDWKYVVDLKKYCEDIYLRPIRPVAAKLRSLSGFITGEALTIPYYTDRKMAHWVDRCLTKHKVDNVVVFSSAMAQYVSGKTCEDTNRVIDFVDVDSDKWCQYSKKRNWPMNYIYSRECHKLLAYETKIAREFDASLFVSSKESKIFRQLSNDENIVVDYFNNGVDYDYFSPKEFTCPFKQAGDEVMVFTGAMDYWANVDAVSWFAKDVFPYIQRKMAGAEFYIVGSNPTTEVKQLGALAGVTVTGRVDDVRPYLRHAKLVVAPMRIARGVQNKVLEAFSMGKPVVATSNALEGIERQHLYHCHEKNEENEFAHACVQELSGNVRYYEQNRKSIQQMYNWERSIQRLEKYLV